LCVKQHLLTNSCGDVAPAVYCFSGLSKWEMPDDELIIWEVEGLLKKLIMSCKEKNN
jgi:hypothetical protein